MRRSPHPLLENIVFFWFNSIYVSNILDYYCISSLFCHLSSDLPVLIPSGAKHTLSDERDIIGVAIAYLENQLFRVAPTSSVCSSMLRSKQQLDTTTLKFQVFAALPYIEGSVPMTLLDVDRACNIDCCNFSASTFT